MAQAIEYLSAEDKETTPAYLNSRNGGIRPTWEPFNRFFFSTGTFPGTEYLCPDLTDNTDDDDQAINPDERKDTTPFRILSQNLQIMRPFGK